MVIVPCTVVVLLGAEMLLQGGVASLEHAPELEIPPFLVRVFRDPNPKRKHRLSANTDFIMV